jgi:ankyrin repeat protein
MSEHIEIVRILLANGANVNCLDVNGATMLHHAAKKGELEFVELLDLYGAIDRVDLCGFTAWDYADMFKRYDVVQFLNERALF